MWLLYLKIKYRNKVNKLYVENNRKIATKIRHPVNSTRYNNGWSNPQQQVQKPHQLQVHQKLRSFWGRKLLPTVLLAWRINNIFKKYWEKWQYPTLCNFKQTTYSKFELKKARNSI